MNTKLSEIEARLKDAEQLISKLSEQKLNENSEVIPMEKVPSKLKPSAQHVPLSVSSNTSLYPNSLLDLTRQQQHYSNINLVHSNVQLRRSDSVFGGYIPQLDGEASNLSVNNLHQLSPKKSAPDPLQCKMCQRLFETKDDFTYHNETQLGREDCLILKSML